MAEQGSTSGASDRGGGDAVQRSMDELTSMLREQTQLVEQLREALASRDVISQAKGILMERRKISADDAYALLRQTSNWMNVKVHAIAQQLAREGSVGELL